ncbi:MAG: hypothetical protein RJA57_529 [Bacteroidota bacterium]
MKQVVYLLTLVLPFLGSGQETPFPFKLSGDFRNTLLQPDWVFIQYRTNGEWKTDSARNTDGTYQFKGKLSEPVLARLRARYPRTADGGTLRMNAGRDMAAVFIGPGKIRVTSVDSFSNIRVRGSSAHTDYLRLQEAGKPYDDQLQRLYDQYAQFNKDGNKEALNRTERSIDSVEEVKKETVYAAFIRKNPGSPVSIYALQQYAGWDIRPERSEPLYALLSESVRRNPSAEQLRGDIETAKKTGIGVIAMEFTQNDTLDRPVTLSAFRGRYLLVDFWASWCGPCRAENPNVVKAFRKYKDRNFHILGVSLDRPGQKEKWMKAIHDDQLEWTHVSDLKFWDNAVAKQYGIKAIPQNILLDPTGRIIAKNLRGEELDQKLAEAMAR